MSNEELKSIEVILKQKGVKDVKLTFTPDTLRTSSIDEIVVSVADLLEKYLRGKITIASIEDVPRDN